MYEKILIPLDGSKIGEAALPYVEELVSKLSPEVKVEIILLQVISPVSPIIVSGDEVPAIIYTEEQMEETKKVALGYLNQTGETLRSKGVNVWAKVGSGNTSEEIVKAAVELNVDLIAMSTHGRSGLSRWALGSVTDKVLRLGGNVPIFMVKAPKDVKKT